MANFRTRASMAGNSTEAQASGDNGPAFARSTGLPDFGKATEDAKTKLPPPVKEDLTRAWREGGYESESAFLREVILVRLYGYERVRSMLEKRLRAAAGLGQE